MKEKILITGASGFIGYHLIEEALKQSLEVFAAVGNTSQTTHLQGLPINIVSLTYTDLDLLQKTLEAGQYQYIIHAAGLTKAKTKVEYNMVNARFTRNLADVAVKADIPLKKFVLMSSLAALGPGSEQRVEHISTYQLPRPLTAYGKSKLLAEKYLTRITDLPLVILRPTAVYGPLERDLFLFIKTLMHGLELYMGHHTQKLSFIYVKDLASITLRATRMPGIIQTAYNLSDGNSYDKYALAEIVRRLLHKKTIQVHLPISAVKVIAFLLEKIYRMGSFVPALNRGKVKELTAANWICSIKEAEQDLGFAPCYNLETGMAETLTWYKENKWL